MRITQCWFARLNNETPSGRYQENEPVDSPLERCYALNDASRVPQGTAPGRSDEPARNSGGGNNATIAFEDSFRETRQFPLTMSLTLSPLIRFDTSTFSPHYRPPRLGSLRPAESGSPFRSRSIMPGDVERDDHRRQKKAITNHSSHNAPPSCIHSRLLPLRPEDFLRMVHLE